MQTVNQIYCIFVFLPASHINIHARTHGNISINGNSDNDDDDDDDGDGDRLSIYLSIYLSLT